MLYLAGENGDVPDTVGERYLRVVVDCYVGNGHEVRGAAEDSNKKMLARFLSTDAGIVLRLFLYPVYGSLMDRLDGQAQYAKLLDTLEPKLTNTIDRNLTAAIREFAETTDKLRLDTRIKQLADSEA